MAGASLSISIVTFAPDERLLARTLASAADAIAFAREQGTLGAARLLVGSTRVPLPDVLAIHQG
jgi:hypothetical protein